MLEERGVVADVAAGHSLGEYSALVYAGALAFADAVRLVHLRGKFMQEAVPEGVGAMAAIIGLDASTVADTCREASPDDERRLPAGELQRRRAGGDRRAQGRRSSARWRSPSRRAPRWSRR